MKKFLILIGIVLVTGLGGWTIWHSNSFRSWIEDRAKMDLPVAEPYSKVHSYETTNVAESTNNANGSTRLTTGSTNIDANIANVNSQVAKNTNTSGTALPVEKNLAVPFTSQAPHANWDQDHEEFCEEASVLMVGRYFRHEQIKNADDAEAALQKIKQWEIEHLGFYYDTTAAETAQVLEGMYGVQVKLVTNPTIEDMKTALSNGKLLIVPTAGQELGNPNFTPPGPIYHNLVIRGYTKDGKFITNDAGTRRGEEYIYRQSVVMSAMHDWVPAGNRTTPRNGSVEKGRKVVLVVDAL